MGSIFAAALAVAPGAVQAGPADLFYERTVMTALDARCGLFTRPVRQALEAGRAQARGAALRAGVAEAEIARLDGLARGRAGSAACASDDVTLAATRVLQAFEGFARMTRMTYPGERAAWRADRTEGEAIRWRLAQDASFDGGRMVFGLAGRGGPDVLIAVASFADGRTPYAARLVLRDSARTNGAYLDVRGEAVMAAPLARRLPPASATRAYAAEARSTAGRDLAPKEMKGGWAFRFPAEAARQLAALDPREAAAVEFLFSGPGAPVVRAYVEVGDFDAGRSFVTAAR